VCVCVSVVLVFNVCVCLVFNVCVCVSVVLVFSVCVCVCVGPMGPQLRRPSPSDGETENLVEL